MATSRPETKQSVVPHAVGHQLLQRLRMPASPETRLTNNDDLDANIGRVRVACVSRDPLTLSVNKKRAHSHIIHFVWRHPWKRSGREVSTARCYCIVRVSILARTPCSSVRYGLIDRPIDRGPSNASESIRGLAGDPVRPLRCRPNLTRLRTRGRG
jgi:hypothetical protein